MPIHQDIFSFTHAELLCKHKAVIIYVSNYERQQLQFITTKIVSKKNNNVDT